MLLGHWDGIGSRSLAGYRPVRMDGTAHPVMAATAVALRYQVEPAARRAKFGYRRGTSGAGHRNRSHIRAAVALAYSSPPPRGGQHARDRQRRAAQRRQLLDDLQAKQAEQPGDQDQVDDPPDRSSEQAGGQLDRPQCQRRDEGWGRLAPRRSRRRRRRAPRGGILPAFTRQQAAAPLEFSNS
jgi:hypothetical protein